MSKTGKNPPTGTKIKNATAASFEIPGDLKAGTYYYFCVISVKGKEYKRTAITSVVVNAAKANSKAATNVIKVISYPTKTAYKVGGGYDTTGVKVVMTSGGTETNITNKITYHIKKINGVELYKGRKFSTTGDKTVELRYNGQAIGTYDIKVSK